MSGRTLNNGTMGNTPSKKNPNWPSKNPGQPSGPKRDSNPPKTPSRPTPPPKMK